MFVSAIDRAQLFTRAIHFVTRYYDDPQVHPGAATLFFVNADGWALTCRHVAAELTEADRLLAKYNDFKVKRSALRGHKNEKQLLKNLESTTGIKKGEPVELYWMVMDCIEGPLSATIHVHPSLDVALVHFTGYNRLVCNTFPVFAANDQDLKQGKTLCRLGFPFPEFTNFAYDRAAERIVWTQTGRIDTPRFPIEGMLTRHLVDAAGAVIGFEMSTPGLRGQSGGPAFDLEARVWGMQSATNHLDLNFDVDMKVPRNGQQVRIKDHAVMHVGHCIHVRAIKEFMNASGVSFQVG